MGYLTFVRRHARLLAFGFAMAFFSAFGQTYFIAQYSADLRALYGLSHSGFGVVYGLATLTSAALLVPVGALIDRVPLRLYTMTVVLGLMIATLIMAFAPPFSVIVLYAAILLLRLCGQGLMTHIAVTTMARRFERLRGRAISLATMGHPAGEAMMPLATAAVVAAVGWRVSWAVVALVLVAVVAPLVLVLVSRNTARAAESDETPVPQGPGRAEAERVAHARSWTRAQMLRDWRFYVLVPALLGPGFINTAVFFAQVEITAQKGWERLAFVAAIPVYAAATVIMAFVTGFLIDRFTARRLFPLALLPLASGMAVLGAGQEPPALALAMGLAGASQGLFGALSGALWAELYGTAHLGAIRALTTSLMVFSTALAPALMGVMFDVGGRIDTIALFFSAYAVAAAGTAGFLWTRRSV
ncbi:MAG: MFS transporter [Alphaproteobacteria bacterium]